MALDITGPSPIKIDRNGLVLQLTATKTSSATQTIVIPRRDDELCAASAVADYLVASGLNTGALFRAIHKGGVVSSRRLAASSVRHILKQRVADAERISPHSLRAGFITSAARAGAPEEAIQRTSRHKSVEVLRSYIRPAEQYATNAAAYL